MTIPVGDVFKGTQGIVHKGRGVGVGGVLRYGRCLSIIVTGLCFDIYYAPAKCSPWYLIYCMYMRGVSFSSRVKMALVVYAELKV